MARDEADETCREVADGRLYPIIVHNIVRDSQTKERPDNLIARRVADPNPGRVLMNGVVSLFALHPKRVRRIRKNMQRASRLSPVTSDRPFRPDRAAFTLVSASGDRVTP